MLHVGAVVGEEDHQHGPGVGEVREGHGLPGGRLGQGEVGGGAPQGHHRGRREDHGGSDHLGKHVVSM